MIIATGSQVDDFAPAIQEADTRTLRGLNKHGSLDQQFALGHPAVPDGLARVIRRCLAAAHDGIDPL